MASSIRNQKNEVVAIGNNMEINGDSCQVGFIHIQNGSNLVQGAVYRIVDDNHPAPGLNVVLVTLPGAGMNTAIFQQQ